MKATAFHHDYPYRLRILHPDYAELRFERKGRFFIVDPAEAPDETDVVLLTSAAPHRSRATVEALQAGKRLTVYATDAVRTWLGKFGAVEAAGDEVDGVGLARMEYAAPSQARPLSHFLKASVAGVRPSFRRLAESVRFPTVEPNVVELRLEDGARLVHLDLALHRDTDPAWLDRAVARFGGAEWLVVGVPWGDGASVIRLAPRFGAKRVLVTEMQNSERREMGLPTELITPVRDQLVAGGVEAHVFATQASYRFE